MLSKLCWCFWQLFPCTYRTYYADDQGRLHFAVWKMWLGRCYQITDVFVDCFQTVMDDTLRLLGELCATATGQDGKAG